MSPAYKGVLRYNGSFYRGWFSILDGRVGILDVLCAVLSYGVLLRWTNR